MYLPKGTLFTTDESYSNYDRSDYDFFDENEYDTKNPIYRVDSDKIKCLNCLNEDIDDSLSIKVEAGDTSASIYYDENGVLVKKSGKYRRKWYYFKKKNTLLKQTKQTKKVYKEIKDKKNNN